MGWFEGYDLAERHRRRPISKRRVWPFLAVKSGPSLVDELGLLQTLEYLAVEQLVAKLAVEAFAVAVFPRTAWLNEQRLRVDPRKSRWDFGWDSPGKPRHSGQRPAPENPAKTSFIKYTDIFKGNSRDIEDALIAITAASEADVLVTQEKRTLVNRVLVASSKLAVWDFDRLRRYIECLEV